MTSTFVTFIGIILIDTLPRYILKFTKIQTLTSIVYSCLDSGMVLACIRYLWPGIGYNWEPPPVSLFTAIVCCIVYLSQMVLLAYLWPAVGCIWGFPLWSFAVISCFPSTEVLIVIDCFKFASLSAAFAIEFKAKNHSWFGFLRQICASRTFFIYNAKVFFFSA